MAEITGPSGRVYQIDEPGSLDADVSFTVGRYTPDEQDTDISMQDVLFLAAYHKSSNTGDWRI